MSLVLSRKKKTIYRYRGPTTVRIKDPQTGESEVYKIHLDTMMAINKFMGYDPKKVQSIPFNTEIKIDENQYEGIMKIINEERLRGIV